MSEDKCCNNECDCGCCCGGMPQIGQDAPAFNANTTQGPISFPSDFKGKWVILFSHPADFTPVCTTEFMTFASMAKEFEDLNVQLIGLSVDSIYAHIAWLRKIQDIEWKGMKDLEVKFPLIEDIKMEVSKKYGMVQSSVSDTQAVRSVFFIDPAGKIRAMIYYPPSLGRNFDEIKRSYWHCRRRTPTTWPPPPTGGRETTSSSPPRDPAGPPKRGSSPRRRARSATTGSSASRRTFPRSPRLRGRRRPRRKPDQA